MTGGNRGRVSNFPSCGPAVSLTLLPQDRINSGAYWRPCRTASALRRIALRIAAQALFLALLSFLPKPAACGVPDVSQSFYVPQRGSVGSPIEGASAAAFFRVCPNNDGGTSLANNARIKVVLRDVNGNPVPDISPADICVLFNGGTPAQEFSGIGADSIIANSAYNMDPVCPDVRCIPADAPTDANGVTYITFTGATPGSPGIGTRDPNRKWGHYDSELPVNALGFNLSGRLTTASANGTYVLRIKNFDTMEGLGIDVDEGAAVTTADFSAIARHIGISSAISYWLDFDSSGSVTASDFNSFIGHLSHDCDFPNNP
jgi:hypothetical protein